jgi:TolA-binding protein
MARRWFLVAAGLLVSTALVVFAQAQPPKPTPPAGGNAPAAKAPGAPPSDVELVERVLACRKEYQLALEQLRAHYLAAGDLKRARWAEEELIQYHRVAKEAYRLELDVPPPKLPPAYNIPEANELYRRALTYKDKGWGNDYIDNQRRAELLLQQLLSNFPESDKRSDTAYQLGDLYEGRAYKQYPRSAQYFERCVQWNPQTQLDARVRAARLYDNQLMDRTRAAELYREVIQHETDQKRIQEAQKRLAELSANK